MSLASRSFGRIRTARTVLLALAVLLALVVAATIWSRRPQKSARAAAPPAPAAPSDALQALEKFRFTSTVSGKKTWTIVADRLLGVSEGVHTLDRIREIELVRPDGKVLRGSADHGSFVEGEAAPAGGRGRGRVVLEGNVRIEGSEGEELLSERVEYDQASQTLLSPGACSFRYRPRADGKGAAPPMAGESNRLAYDLAANRAELDGGVLLRLQEAGEPETIVRAARAELAVDASVATFTGGMTIERGEDRLTAPKGRVERGSSGAGRLEAGPGATARLVRAAGVAPTLAAADRITVEQRASSAGAGRTVTLAGNASIEEGAAPGGAATGGGVAPRPPRPPRPAPPSPSASPPTRSR